MVAAASFNCASQTKQRTKELQFSIYSIYLYIQYFKTFENYCYISFDVLRGGGVRKSSKCRNYMHGPTETV